MSEKYNTEIFISKARQVHGDKFDYSKVNYVNSQTKVTIICPIHGEFEQKPNNHLNGQGCIHCKYENQSLKFPEHEERFKDVEGKKYVAVDNKSDFTTDDYKNQSGVITTYLKKTYNIEQPFSNFKARNYFKMNNHYWWEDYLEIKLVDDVVKETVQCPYCDWTTTDLENKSGMMITHFKKEHNITLETVLKEHPEMKDYFKNTKIVDLRTPEEYVICEICGEKLGSINTSHLRSHNMTWIEYKKKYRTPMVSQVFHDKCHESGVLGNKSPYFQTNERFTSKAELEIKEFIQSKGLEISKNRSILNGKELDMFIPSQNIAIEYNGCKWHTEWFGKKDKYYHYNKMIECNKKGVRLIHIFEDEYMYHKDIVLSKIEHILGIHTELPKVGARKCSIVEIKKDVSDKFLDINHIQGKVNATIYLGAYYNNDLVAVMTLKKQNNNNYELNRFATNNKIIVSGIASRLLKYFIKNFSPTKIISFADRRWTTNLDSNLYTKLGFTLDYCTSPDYHYYNDRLDSHKRFHKFGFRKQILHNKYGFDLSMTETEMVRELGYDRIWDCGLAKYVYDIGNNI